MTYQILGERIGIGLIRSDTVEKAIREKGIQGKIDETQRPVAIRLTDSSVKLRAYFQQNDEYPTIASRAKKEKAEIHWGDKTGLCNDSYHGRSYAPRGNTPAIRIHPRCERVNLISTVTNQGKVRFMVYKDKMNSGTMIQFMERLINGSDHKILLILDNIKVHHSHLVRDWLKEHKAQIEAFFLPSYSPELNPDEYLNCDFKCGVHSDIPARTKNNLKKKTVSHLGKLQKMPKRVMKYFIHPRIAYAA